MKGQRQLVWSRGLKAEVGIVEKTDVELAAEEVAKVEDSIDITPAAWRFVIGNDARWELVHAAESTGRKGVRELLNLLGWVPDGET